MRIRQVALATRQLEAKVQDFCSVLGVEVAYSDPAIRVFGLRNAVMPIGDTFLEALTPIEPDTAAGRFLDRRGGDGGYMVILQTDDLDADRKRMAELGVRIVWEVTLPQIATIHLHPRDVGGSILSFDVAHPPESWHWAGPEWETKAHTEIATLVTGVELQAEDPAALAERWSEVVARTADRVEADAYEIRLDRGALRFVPDREGGGEGISAIELAVADPSRLLRAARLRNLESAEGEVRICGTRIRWR
jgi:hypothetical protein